MDWAKTRQGKFVKDHPFAVGMTYIFLVLVIFVTLTSTSPTVSGVDVWVGSGDPTVMQLSNSNPYPVNFELQLMGYDRVELYDNDVPVQCWMGFYYATLLEGDEILLTIEGEGEYNVVEHELSFDPSDIVLLELTPISKEGVSIWVHASPYICDLGDNIWITFGVDGPLETVSRMHTIKIRTMLYVSADWVSWGKVEVEIPIENLHIDNTVENMLTIEGSTLITVPTPPENLEPAAIWMDVFVEPRHYDLLGQLITYGEERVFVAIEHDWRDE